MKIRVYDNETIAVKIVSSNGYSASPYLFRFKRYDVGIMRFFNYETEGDLDATSLITYINGLFHNNGYTAYSYSTASAALIYSSLPMTNIVYTLGHSEPGYIFAGNHTTLFAKYDDSNGENNRAIESYALGQLAGLDLLVFAGCGTGATCDYYGNLVSMALSRGAKCCIGWKQSINQWLTHVWLEEFSYALNCGNSVKYAMIEADTWTQNRCSGTSYASVFYRLTDREIGSSPTWSYILG